MKNLVVERPEKLDELPKREKLHKADHGYWHQAYHCGRVERWLASHVGEPWNDVVSAFTKLPWVPHQNRTYSHLVQTHVEVKTFMEGGKVMYFQNWAYPRNNFRPIDEEIRPTLYLHPVKKTLEIFVPKGKKTRHAEWIAKQPLEFIIVSKHEQLIKSNGVWFLYWVTDLNTKTDWWKYRTIDYTRPFNNQKIGNFELLVGHKMEMRPYYRYDYTTCKSTKDGMRELSIPVYRTVIGPKLHCQQADSKLLKKHNVKNDFQPIKYGRLKY